MNYRHSFHAGNFADVVKHVVLTRIVEYLKRKDKAFRVIDTHAGAGMYDLGGPDAGRTGEWLNGFGRLEQFQEKCEAVFRPGLRQNKEMERFRDSKRSENAVADAPSDPVTAHLLAPYLDAVAAARRQGASLYPGSPWIVRHLLRRQDRLSAIELHPEDFACLRELFAGDVQVRATQLDGWLALGAHVPPKERRGLVLVDPPFEREAEFEWLLEGAIRCARRWQGGIQALWYPLKNRAEVARFRDGLAASGVAKVLDLRLSVRAPSPEPRLDGCGVAVINPPFVLEEEMRALLPTLARLLQMDDGAGADVVWLARPPSDA